MSSTIFGDICRVGFQQPRLRLHSRNATVWALGFGGNTTFVDTSSALFCPKCNYPCSLRAAQIGFPLFISLILIRRIVFCWRSDVPGRNYRIRSNGNIALPPDLLIHVQRDVLLSYHVMIKCCKECFNHHYCFLSFSFPCLSFHSFPHLVEGQRCVSPVPDTSVLHLFIPFLTFSFPYFILSFLSSPFPFHAYPMLLFTL